MYFYSGPPMQFLSGVDSGSGGQKNVDGWFSRLFIKQPKGMREVTNFPTQ